MEFELGRLSIVDPDGVFGTQQVCALIAKATNISSLIGRIGCYLACQNMSLKPSSTLRGATVVPVTRPKLLLVGSTFGEAKIA